MTINFSGKIAVDFKPSSRLIPVLAVAVCALAFPFEAAAKTDPVFTVSNYPVEASDANAVVAKEKALAEGQQAAFRALLKRLVPVTAYKQLDRVKTAKAADFVSGVAVRSERNSSTQYLANLDYSFDPEGVKSLLSREGIAFVDKQAEPLTIVTVTREGNPAVAKNDTGAWREAWAGLDLANTLTPMKLETLKPVIHNDTVAMMLSGDDNGQRILAREYNSERIVLAVAEADPQAQKLTVTLTGQDAVGPLFLKRTFRVKDGDLAYASELAAVVGLGVLEGRWKAIKAAGSIAAVSETQGAAASAPAWSAAAQASEGQDIGERVQFVAEFAGEPQWDEIRTQLLDTPGVDNVEISSISASSADIALSYPGGAQRLANAVGARGLALTNAGNRWIMRSTH